MEVILYIIAFLAIVVVLGLITAWSAGIDLRKDPGELAGRPFILYGILRPLLAPARLVVRLFCRKPTGAGKK